MPDSRSPSSQSGKGRRYLYEGYLIGQVGGGPFFRQVRQIRQVGRVGRSTKISSEPPSHRGVRPVRGRHPPHPTGCHSASPRVGGGKRPRTTGGEKDTVYVIDPCGRTSLCRCDHKGRGIWGPSQPAGLRLYEPRPGAIYVHHQIYIVKKCYFALCSFCVIIRMEFGPSRGDCKGDRQ